MPETKPKELEVGTNRKYPDELGQTKLKFPFFPLLMSNAFSVGMR
jgi:hypothetical protein